MKSTFEFYFGFKTEVATKLSLILSWSIEDVQLFESFNFQKEVETLNLKEKVRLNKKIININWESAKAS